MRKTARRLLQLGVAVILLVVFVAYGAAITTLVVTVAFTAVVGTFTILYTKRSHWRDSAPGRALGYSMLSWFGLGLISLVGIVFGDYPGREYVRVFFFLVILLSQLDLLIALLNAQRRERQDALDEAERIYQAKNGEGASKRSE